MNTQELTQTANTIMAPDKGILAADESLPSAGERLDSVGLENTQENRRLYRELFFTTQGIGEYLSAVILFEETMEQSAGDGTPFMQLLSEHGIIPGIKVDKGTVPMEDTPNELVTQGLDGLSERLHAFYEQGARFAKWRAVILIDEASGLPTDACIEQNAQIMAQYAIDCQNANIVPVIEPEVLYDKGVHSIDVAQDVTMRVLKSNFAACKAMGVYLPGVILKSSMVLAAKDSGAESTPEQVAVATLRTFNNSVPDDVPGIVFLSGGQSAEQATVNLSAVRKMQDELGRDDYPWEISFSYGRGLQGEALKTWDGKAQNVPAAREEFIKRLKATQQARLGNY